MTCVKVIHVSQSNIKKNSLRRNDELPVFHIGEVDEGVWTGEEAREIIVTGTVRLVYNRKEPLPIGARVWIEVEPGSKIEVKK